MAQRRRGMSGGPTNHPLLTRRDFTRWAGAAALLPPTAAALASCGQGTESPTGAVSLQVATPRDPVTWPISEDNQPIESGLEPERDATLKIYNYADYVDTEALNSFQEKFAEYNVTCEVTTFNDIPEALAKLRSGEVDFDIFFPAPDSIGKLVTSGLIRPINHDYVPNISNVWEDFANPFYDGEWRYTIPYSVYTTGIAWRTDIIAEDISLRDNPWDVFWDPQYAGLLSVLDDYRETLGMALQRNGVNDFNTIDPALIKQAQDDLLQLNELTSPKVTINYYSELPEGQHGLSHAWSGDAVNFTYYMPEDLDPAVFRYWYPGAGQGRIDNDLVTIVKAGANPVLAHEFLNHMLDPDVAVGNFFAIGYQMPQNSLVIDEVIAQELVPATMPEAVVLREYFADGLRILELPPEVDGEWLAAWQQFKAGA